MIPIPQCVKRIQQLAMDGGYDPTGELVMGTWQELKQLISNGNGESLDEYMELQDCWLEAFVQNYMITDLIGLYRTLELYRTAYQRSAKPVAVKPIPENVIQFKLKR